MSFETGVSRMCGVVENILKRRVEIAELFVIIDDPHDVLEVDDLV